MYPYFVLFDYETINFAFVNHNRIRSFNQPLFINEGKLSACLTNTTVAFDGVSKLTFDRLRVRCSTYAPRHPLHN